MDDATCLIGAIGRAVQDKDKRDAERTLIVGELRGDMMVFQPMQVKDISRGGLTIETLFPLQLDSLHDVRLTLGDSSVVAKGRVVHSRISSVNQDIVAYRSGDLKEWLRGRTRDNTITL